MKSIFLLITFSILFSCSSDDIKGKTEAEKLYKEAMEYKKKERYILATEKINLIKTQHPYSFYATPAELLLGEVQYEQESFIESAASFLLFRDFHPKHEKIPYVVFMIGESYFKQLPKTIDRDLDSGVEALKFYQEVLDKYPETTYVKDSKKRISEINKMLMEKDQYIADFYFKTSVYQAAEYWYKEILEKYPTHQKIKNHCQLRLVLSSYKLKKFGECKSLAEKFTTEVDKETKKEIKSIQRDCEEQMALDKSPEEKVDGKNS